MLSSYNFHRGRWIEFLISGGFRRGREGSPPGAQILSISCSFREKLAKSYVGGSLGSWRPPPGEILDLPLLMLILIQFCRKGEYTANDTGSVIAITSRRYGWYGFTGQRLSGIFCNQFWLCVSHKIIFNTDVKSKIVNTRNWYYSKSYPCQALKWQLIVKCSNSGLTQKGFK